MADKVLLSSAYGEFNMDELEKNTFVKMHNDGWCKTCDYDSNKCAKQHECEAFKTLKQQMSGVTEDGE